MLILRLFLIVLSVLLNACASLSMQSNETENTSISPKIVQPQEILPKKEVKTAIQPDVMFLLMTAELAGQRGRYDVAFEGYMEAAKRVKDARFAERAAMIAMYIKDVNKTKEAVNLWLGLDKNNQSALKIAALSSLIIGDNKTAAEHLDVLFKLDMAGFEKSSLELAAMLPKEAKAKLTYDVLTDLLAKHPNNSGLFFIKSLLAMQINDKKEAEYNIQKALTIQPEWDKALMFQAQLALLSGNMDKALADLRVAAEKHPENDKIKKLYAQLLIKNKDFQQAEKIYQQLIKRHPEDNENQFALALIYLQAGNDDSAESLLLRLVEDNQWQDQASFYLGKLEEKHNNSSAAIKWYDKVKSGPSVFDAGLSAAILFAKDKNFDDAKIRLRTLVKQFPKQKAKLLLMEAEFLNQQRQFQQAFDLLTGVLADAPDDKDILYTHALIADRLGRLDILEMDLNKVLAKDPDNTQALNALGYALVVKTDRFAEAEQYLLRAIKLAPKEAVILDSYGWLEFKRGHLTNALDYLQRAFERQKETEIAAHLVEVMWVMGKKEEAKALFKEVYKRSSEDEFLLDFKRRVLDKAL